MTYFHVDHQGTPIARSDAWGVVFERTRRESFGLPLTGPLKNGPGYTGHMEDPGTGLVYMQQRYYDPAIGRFLSVDPVGPLADPTNHFGRYHYGLNNPYRFIDPDGRCTGSRVTNADGTCRSTGGWTTQSVGQLIDRGGEAAAMRGDRLATAGYALAHAGWTMFGAEDISKRAAGQESSVLGVGLEGIAAVPVVGAIVRGGVAVRGITVLGKFPDYLTLADELGAKRFNIPTSVWNRMSTAEQWTANRTFLDRAIARGDEIVLSNPVRNINEVSGAFRQELDYLITHGFRLSPDGTRLVK
jgi:RHS repeat-associated protein